MQPSTELVVLLLQGRSFQILSKLSRDQLLCALRWVLGWEWDRQTHTHSTHTLGKDMGQTRKHRSCPKCFALAQRTGSVGCQGRGQDRQLSPPGGSAWLLLIKSNKLVARACYLQVTGTPSQPFLGGGTLQPSPKLMAAEDESSVRKRPETGLSLPWLVLGFQAWPLHPAQRSSAPHESAQAPHQSSLPALPPAS